MRACLATLDERYYPLADDRPLVIGSEVDHVDIPLRDPQVSGRHACVFSFARGGAVLVDLRSTNGTRVNGEKITRAHLRNGDKIQLGETLLVFSRREEWTRKPVRASDRELDVTGLVPLHRWYEGEDPARDPRTTRIALELFQRLARWRERSHLLGDAAVALRKSLSAPLSVLFLEEDGELTCKAVGLPRDVGPDRAEVRVAEELARAALEAGGAMHVPDSLALMRRGGELGERTADLGPGVAAPLRSPSERGAVVVLRRRLAPGFGAPELALVDAVAEHTGVLLGTIGPDEGD